MNELESNTLKVSDSGKNGQKTCKLNYQPSYSYKCDNCENKIKEEVMLDFVEVMPDNKLTCPFCMSILISEVEA